MKIAREISIALYGVVLKLLNMESGEERTDIPFTTRYKLQRNSALFEKDYVSSIDFRDNLLKEYGTLDEEKQEYLPPTDEETLKEVRDKLTAYLKEPVSYDPLLLKPEELEIFKGVKLTTTETDLLIVCLTDDPEIRKELGLDS